MEFANDLELVYERELVNELEFVNELECVDELNLANEPELISKGVQQRSHGGNYPYGWGVIIYRFYKRYHWI